MKLFNSKLKKNPVFLEEPFRVFHHCFFRCFNLTIDFYHCFRVFSLLIALVHFITVSPGIFISPLILLLFSRVFSFHQRSLRGCFLSCTSLLCCCTVSATDFYSQAIFTLHSFPTFGTSSFIKASLGPAVPL